MPGPSIRNLADGGMTPLRKFYGDILEVVESEKQGQGGAYTQESFRMNNLEVQQSTEPYILPVAEITISASNRKKTRWGFFADSVLKFLADNEDFKDLKGRRIGWVYTDGLDGRPTPKKTWDRRADDGKGAEVPTPAWEVFDVVGSKSSVTPDKAVEEAKSILDGKSISEFNKAVFANPIVRQSPDLQRVITDQSFVKSLVQVGEFTKDANDIYHRVKK